MTEQKQQTLTKEEVIKIRHDLIEAGWHGALNEIVDGKLSLYFTNNFRFLLDTPYSSSNLFKPRKWYPDKAKAIDELVEKLNFNLSRLKDKEYFNGNEAQKEIFPLYLKMHEEKGFPYGELLR